MAAMGGPRWAAAPRTSRSVDALAMKTALTKMAVWRLDRNAAAPFYRTACRARLYGQPRAFSSPRPCGLRTICASGVEDQSAGFTRRANRRYLLAEARPSASPCWTVRLSVRRPWLRPNPIREQSP
jgi:hypothetical protein